jgi:hypothetical protein
VLDGRRVQDAGVVGDCERCVKETVERLGGIDVIVGNAVSLVKDLGGLVKGRRTMRVKLQNQIVMSPTSLMSLNSEECLKEKGSGCIQLEQVLRS